MIDFLGSAVLIKLAAKHTLGAIASVSGWEVLKKDKLLKDAIDIEMMRHVNCALTLNFCEFSLLQKPLDRLILSLSPGNRKSVSTLADLSLYIS